MTSHNRSIMFAAAAAAFVSSAAAQGTVLISDDFEANSAMDYTVVDDGTPDGTQTFAFDYVAAGIPLAPRSSAGDTRGLKLTANDTVGATDAWTLFHNVPVTSDQYRLTVDVFCNFIMGGATTEHAHVGVGGNGTTFNQLFSPISGTGAYIAFVGDGGNISDYRWFRDPNNTPPGGMGNTTLPNDHPSYLGHGSNNTGPFFQNLFPSPPSTIAGSPGNIWTTLEIDVDQLTGVISFYFDGQLTFQGNFGGRFDGQISLGHADVYTSISGVLDVFTVFDNLTVETGLGGFGTNYCTPVANSTGNPASISGAGSVLAADNDVTLTADGMPLNAFGFFLTSQMQGTIMQPGGSQGVLCLTGAIGRYVGPGQIQNSGATGAFALALDLTQHPTPTGLVSVVAGETWSFQAWHRDAVGGSATSNFTDGLEVTFQ